MIYKGTKELENLYLGNKELEAVYLGNKEIWTNNVGIYLGSGTSFNIRTLLPNVDYTQLTVNNFYAINGNSNYQIWHGGDSKYKPYRTWVENVKSYNASTGVLTFYYRGMYSSGQGSGTHQNYNAQVMFVKKPSKLVSFTTGSGAYNVKNLFPNDYQKMTANNFFIKNFRGYGDDIGGWGSQSWTFQRINVKSYNASNGTLTWYNNKVDPDDGTLFDSGFTVYALKRVKV